jgi:hypothetical protein
MVTLSVVGKIQQNVIAQNFSKINFRWGLFYTIGCYATTLFRHKLAQILDELLKWEKNN